MEVDVEIALPAQGSESKVEWHGQLPEGYYIEKRGTRRTALFLRGPTSVGKKVDECIFKFLSGLHALEADIRPLGVPLRVGVFYDLTETVVFPFRLAFVTVEKIAEFRLSIDAAIYVCGEDDD